MDPFGMQVEASYRKHDYERRAARMRLLRSVRAQQPADDTVTMASATRPWLSLSPWFHLFLAGLWRRIGRASRSGEATT